MQLQSCVIRTDASSAIGTGHVMRCRTLAAALRQLGAKVEFLCRTLEGDMTDYLLQQGFAVHRMATTSEKLAWESDAAETAQALRRMDGVDWLVVDHYALDARWEGSLRAHAGSILAIDDLANRPHDCDLLLDQNLYRDTEQRYRQWLPPGCRPLLGPGYALLRQEFAHERAVLRVRDGSVKRLLITYGGADPSNETRKALDAYAGLADADITVDVVVGASNPHRQEIEAVCRTLPGTNFIYQADNMAELMARADLVLGAGGSTTWERCCLGLPSLTTVLADNQRETTLYLHELGATHYIGEARSLAASDYRNEILRLMRNPAQLARQSVACRQICDGCGAERVAKELQHMTMERKWITE